MYRIIFNTNTAKWQVQLQVYVIFWKTVKTNPLGFENYDLASAYVESVGLDKVYRNFRETPAHQLWAGEPVQYAAQASPLRRTM